METKKGQEVKEKVELVNTQKSEVTSQEANKGGTNQ